MNETNRHGWRVAARALADLAWPITCAGCERWGESLCASCSAAMTPRDVLLRPVWSPDLEVRSAVEFAGPVRHAITAFKDEGRRDLGPLLASLLRDAVARAIRHAWSQSPSIVSWQYVLVPSAPASTRARGRFPLGELACGLDSPLLHAGPRLQLRRRVRDQAGLTREQRRENLLGAYQVRRGDAGSLEGVGVVLVDDVVTTGATLAAAREAIRPLRPEAVVAATVAATGTSAKPPLGGRAGSDAGPSSPAHARAPNPTKTLVGSRGAG